ncbi:hypothetical protein E3N88_23992 [Mikania micrantha]|uniref:Phorbol-ester/DAG-type domain-containing protein n=1 Tax=Mikania micrantha TaxID=192012 RepID=A0A5N6NEU3_9ASTR|nr:hypothetical protein E3N88_23992 [Mikania micrantha]
MYSLNVVTMEQLDHFSHEHVLSLVQLQPRQENYNKEDEDEDGMIFGCKDCNYSLHKFCAQLPKTEQNHPLHPGHDLTLSQEYQLSDPDFKLEGKFDSNWMCEVCNIERCGFYNYHCYICKFTMDIICANMSEQKMNHPSHPHQLQRYFSRMISSCYACGDEHSGTFFHCTTCSWFRIHLDCCLLPAKLLIQQFTDGSFSHSHKLTLSFSFPYIERKAKFLPDCRVCECSFYFNKWLYRCDRCRYYAHVRCATSRKDAFMSYLTYAGPGKTYKNFKDDDHSNLIRCPFSDESFNLLMHHFINKGKLPIKGKIDGNMFSHEHPLVLFDTQESLLDRSVSLHDPVKRVQLLCDGCVRPITDIPFYKCSQHSCDFVLHEWCTRLPSEIQDHHDHPEHTLVLLQKAPTDFFGVFWCEICDLPCNGFAYGCTQCEYYVDVNCGFIPDVITHEAHPNHLLQRYKPSILARQGCKACFRYPKKIGYYCPPCDFFLDNYCALLLPGTIRHTFDKHPLSLRYDPAENHASEYFCEICEDEFDPIFKWFYHCSTCASSMHTVCAPLKLQCEQSTSSFTKFPIFVYYNVKFGRRYKIRNHQHDVTFVQGINADGQCMVCHQQLRYYMIFKCFPCKYAIHIQCA